MDPIGNRLGPTLGSTNQRAGTGMPLLKGSRVVNGQLIMSEEALATRRLAPFVDNLAAFLRRGGAGMVDVGSSLAARFLRAGEKTTYEGILG